MKKIDYDFEGFMQLKNEEKLNLVAQNLGNPDDFKKKMKACRFSDDSMQEKLEQLSENTISNFHLPFGIAPNFLVDGTTYHVPMVTEEKGVLEAAARAAGFWHQHGGFQTEDIATAKFACDITKCKGACCVVGDAGAPVDREEIPVLNKAFKKEQNSEKGKFNFISISLYFNNCFFYSLCS